jgi:hypothetical protein
MQAKPDEFGVYTREFLIKDEPLSEDCLYLNVWTGAKNCHRKKAGAGLDLWRRLYKRWHQRAYL